MSGEQRDLVLFSHSQTRLNLSERMKRMFTNNPEAVAILRSPAADGVQCVQPLFELDYDLAPVHTHEKNGVRVEPWYADTGAPFHVTDSLACMTDLQPCQKSVKRIGGVSVEMDLAGTVEFTTKFVHGCTTCYTLLTWGTIYFLQTQSLMASHGII